jgi:hypothetical protein
MGTPDGKDLGSFARQILVDIAYDDNKSMLYAAMCGSNVFSRNAIPAMLREESVTSVESLRDLD